MNLSEPFGLPAGSVRGIIALAFTAVTLYLFATGQVVPDALLAVNTLVVGNYFGSRGVAATIVALKEPVEEVAPPYIPADPLARG